MKWTDISVSGIPIRAEISVLLQALASNPDHAACRLRLVHLLAYTNQFEEAARHCMAGLSRLGDFAELRIVLAECHNAMGHAEAARAVLEDLPESLGPGIRSRGWYERGVANEVLGERDAAKTAYLRSLEAQPESPRPCKSLHALQFADSDVAGVFSNCDDLARRGVRHARLHADRMLATAIAGRKREALETFAFAQFSHFSAINSVSDLGEWPDIVTFNRTVCDELANHGDIQYGRRLTASRNSWRVENPFSGHGRGALMQLRDLVRRAVERYVAQMPLGGHFFSEFRPESVTCTSWAVNAPGDGFEDWHVHPGAWLTGVYYVRVPEQPLGCDDRGGCITFGLPDFDGMPDAGADWTTIRPQAGMLALFPSHCFHRTWPTGLDENRWIVAFDIQPSVA